MARKSLPKAEPKLTDAERHARFKDMAREVEASERPDDFDSAFERLTGHPQRAPQAK